ncbi:MAG: putative nucleotidyltransferase [Candidatus Saganbacteria bacterium]|uniref:Putative nucleotidyltransferase n=1 Tax=Candidatus Saganbacteria bacterium TaxID=2575572 RepID=A0A833L285_UNCSA|nr:MAG: putative nucleotidyltransferase [Candidatus Saganbacteria bacterium]
MMQLFAKSKIRQRIILLFIYNQNKEFYLSEIAKKVRTSAGTAQRELNRLLGSDLIVFKKKAILNIYALNRHYSLLPEVESIIKKTFGIEVELKKELGKVRNISFAFLFGSFVKGGFKSDSDIDLFVIGEVDENRMFKMVRKVEEKIGREINYHIATEGEFSEKKKTNYFHKDIVKNCILLRGDEHEFRKFIK